MGTLTQILWDGQTNGTSITASSQMPGNTGWTLTAPSTMSYTTADGMRGTSGLRVNVSTGTAIVRYGLAASNASVSCSMVLTMPTSNPSAFAPFFALRNTGRVLSLGISTNGRLYVADGAASGGTVSYITPTVGTLSLGGQYRIELQAHQDATSPTTASTINAKVYNPTDTSSPISTLTPITNANLTANGTTGAIATVEIGNSTPAAISFGMDDLQFLDGGTTEIGPILVPLTTPTVTLGTTTNPSTVGGSNGSQVVTWGSVANATSYDAYKATNGSPLQSDFSLVASNVTSPYTFTGLTAGTYSFGIMAKP